LIGLWFAALVLGGCGAPAGGGPGLPDWQRPELLYLLAQPYPSLYVEIDTVEGVQPDEDALAALKDFLRRHCHKPDGIRFLRDKPIPLTQAERTHPHGLALMHMSGPPGGGSAPQAAYLYVLIFDSKRMRLPKPHRVHVSTQYPCAIYIDVAWEPLLHKRAGARMAQHEAGHILGLCKNTSHGDGAHCRNKGCPMGGVTFSTSRWLFGLPPTAQQLCQDCLDDLTAARQSGPDGHLSFSGPALVRRENGYFVASLPLQIQVSFRPAASFDGRQMQAAAHKALAEAMAKARKGTKKQVLPLVHCPDDFEDAPARRAAYQRLTRDPDPRVAAWAKRELKKLQP